MSGCCPAVSTCPLSQGWASLGLSGSHRCPQPSPAEPCLQDTGSASTSVELVPTNGGPQVCKAGSDLPGEGFFTAVLLTRGARRSLVVGAVLGTVGCLAAFPASPTRCQFTFNFYFFMS